MHAWSFYELARLSHWLFNDQGAVQVTLVTFKYKKIDYSIIKKSMLYTGCFQIKKNVLLNHKKSTEKINAVYWLLSN